MDAEENLFGRTGFYGWTQKKIFLGVQDFTDGRRRKSFWAYRILLTVAGQNISCRTGKTLVCNSDIQDFLLNRAVEFAEL